ncbi:MAG: SRPBCC domain-containing protein [Euryarchaeota archaeon]|nr:SRPBCC domain-containing protein [Euryarchaeota archaeon]
MNFKPTLFAFDDNKEIRWIGKVWPGMIFDGEHSLMILERKEGGVTFAHSEKFRGTFVPLFKKDLESHTKPGFENMIMALKALCENI